VGLSRKHYVSLAEVVRTDFALLAPPQRRLVARSLASWLQREDASGLFNRARFLDACRMPGEDPHALD
jgi:hypothetical protein